MYILRKMIPPPPLQAWTWCAVCEVCNHEITYNAAAQEGAFLHELWKHSLLHPNDKLAYAQCR